VSATLKRERIRMNQNITVAFDDSDPMSVYKNRVFGFKLRSFSREGINQRVREAVMIPGIRVRKKEGEGDFLRGRQN
jgi:hypothetical protein